ncbi:MAG TPA: Gfo/Idh/MocA family oxidoreductase [Bryobacteraceae bacterium]|nr:Gfo/Idh/MocA family oxidoreductase [Bryobacteraceae bacterium]
MANLRFAAFGAGFWANFQLAGWKEIGGTECVAIYNRTKSKAERIAQQFGIPRVYDNPEELMRNEQVDFLDIITDVDTHPLFVDLAAQHKKPVVCQKPFAPTLAIAEDMLHRCQHAGVQLYINENWRWQTPIRELARVLRSGIIGTPFRARIDMISGFPVFKNQPFLAELDQFIVTDLGSHTLDVARFLFGEAKTLYCHTQRVHSNIKGEDVATILMRMGPAATSVVVQMAYAGNYLERDRFPETAIFIEGDKGSLELTLDYWIRTTTAEGTHIKRYPPPRYTWADPAYDVVHSSIVPAQANILKGLTGEAKPETTGDDNLETVRLVFSSYDSAASGKEIRF